MAQFVAQYETTLPVEVAWQRLTDWQRHAQYVPFTTITLETPPPNGVGTVFNARTRLGRFAFDDPMEIVEWDEPNGASGGTCRLEKRGRLMLGWAELSVTPAGTGSRATWVEDITVARLPRAAAPVTALTSKLLFSRVLKRLLEDA